MSIKLASVRSPTYLTLVRERACVKHALDGALDVHANHAHHYPFRSKGVTNDLRTAPLCVECHDRCHGLNVAGKTTIARDEQSVLVATHAAWFFEFASNSAWAQVGEDRADLDRWARTHLQQGVPREGWVGEFESLASVQAGPEGAWFVFNATASEWAAIGAQRSGRTVMVPY